MAETKPFRFELPPEYASGTEPLCIGCGRPGVHDHNLPANVEIPTDENRVNLIIRGWAIILHQQSPWRLVADAVAAAQYYRQQRSSSGDLA